MLGYQPVERCHQGNASPSFPLPDEFNDAVAATAVDLREDDGWKFAAAVPSDGTLVVDLSVSPTEFAVADHHSALRAEPDA